MLTFLSPLAALVLSAPLQEPNPAPTGEAKPRTTVLQLEGGTVLRAKARERADGWEVWSGGEWRLVPTGMVRSARSEYELLDQAETLARALPKGDLVRRVAYADWLVSAGLHVEALEELDRVLERAPDQKDALALLARADIHLALPETPRAEAELDAWFAAGARLGCAAREIAVQRLATAPEIPGLRSALARELVARTSGRRSLATLVLRRMFAGAETQGLLSRAVLDSSSEVRASAALALKACGDAAVIAPALRAVDSKHGDVRVNAIEALGTMDYREAVEPLFLHLVALQAGGENRTPHVHIFNGRQRSYVQDFDVEVAQGQAIADPIINILIEGSVLDVGVVGVSEFQVATERSAVRRALAKLTGANPGDTTAAWQRWWKEHGDEWQAGATPQKAPTTPAGQG